MKHQYYIDVASKRSETYTDVIMHDILVSEKLPEFGVEPRELGMTFPPLGRKAFFFRFHMHQPTTPTILSNKTATMTPMAIVPPVPMPLLLGLFELPAASSLDLLVVVSPEGTGGEGGVFLGGSKDGVGGEPRGGVNAGDGGEFVGGSEAGVGGEPFGGTDAGDGGEFTGGGGDEPFGGSGEFGGGVGSGFCAGGGGEKGGGSTLGGGEGELGGVVGCGAGELGGGSSFGGGGGEFVGGVGCGGGETGGGSAFGGGDELTGGLDVGGGELAGGGED